MPNIIKPEALMSATTKTVRAIAQRAQKAKVGVKFHNGQSAYTDGRQMVLPIPKSSRPEDLRAARTVANHEIGHHLFTDFEVMKEAHARGASIAFTLNVLEDIREEDLMSRMFPGARSDFRADYKHRAPEYQQVIDNNQNPIDRVFVAGIFKHAGGVNLKLDDLCQEALDTIFSPIALEVLNLYGKSDKYAASKRKTRRVMELAESLWKRLLAFFQLAKQNQEERKSQASDQDKGQSEGESEGESEETESEGEESEGEESEGESEGEAEGEESEGESEGEESEGEESEGESEGESEETESEGESEETESEGESEGGEGSKTGTDELDLSDWDGDCSDVGDDIREDRMKDCDQRTQDVRDLQEELKNVGRFEVPTPGELIFDCNQATFDAYEAMVKEDSKNTNKMVQVLRGMAKKYQMSRQEFGVLDRRMLPHVVSGATKRGFKSVKRVEAKSIAVTMVLDLSGSMGGSRGMLAKRAVAHFASICHKCNVPTEIIRFDHKFQVVKGFKDNWRKEGIRKRLYGTRTRGGTCTHQPVLYGAASLGQQCVDRHVMIIVSDGDTTDSYETRELVSNMKKAGFEVYGFGLNTDAIGSYMDKEDWVKLPSASNFGPALTDRLFKFLWGGITSRRS